MTVTLLKELHVFLWFSWVMMSSPLILCDDVTMMMASGPNQTNTTSTQISLNQDNLDCTCTVCKDQRSRASVILVDYYNN